MKYFTYSEFDSPDAPGSGKRMNPTLLRMLDRAREIAGVPFIINSGYRTPQYNSKVGGVPHSAHTKGMAVDIHTTPQTYPRILQALLRVGFKRIGLGPNFIHVDIDYSKPYPAVWTYNGVYSNLALAIKQKLSGEKKKIMTATLPLLIVGGLLIWANKNK